MLSRSFDSTSRVPTPTAIDVITPMRATINANQNHPDLSPEPLLFVIEKNKTIGMMATPTILAPIVEPIRAKVAIFSRS